MNLPQLPGVGQVAVAGGGLRVESMSKTFGGQRVLRDAHLHVQPGEIHALVGQNGSGKSTLIKILAGYHAADTETQISINGESFDPRQAGASDAAGLRFVHQDLALVGALSAVENLGLGSGYGVRRGLRVKWSERRRDARRALDELGYEIDVDRPVEQLEASERTAVAVARALSPHNTTPRAVVLDEPTANLPGPEVERLFTLIRNLRTRGLAIVFVTHHLGEVFELADRVTVLRGGEVVASQSTASLDESALIELMVGRELAAAADAPAPPRSRIVLDVRSLGGTGIQELDLSVAAGEVVGIAGITGSGREKLASLIFGGAPRSGQLSVDERVVRSGMPHESIASGMAFVPADRRVTAIFTGHDSSENLSIVGLGEFSRRGRLSRRREMAHSLEWIDRLDVRPRDPRAIVDTLSGGNAQKVVLARWLRTDPRVLILDEPTQGVDIGAKADIYRLVTEAAERGCAVVVCSTDSEELARMCHRVVVLVDGRAARELAAPLKADGITRATLATTTGANQ